MDDSGGYVYKNKGQVHTSRIVHRARGTPVSVLPPFRPSEVKLKRTTSFLVALGFLSVSPLILAQEPSPIPPYSSSDLLGPDLIAWTEQQKPQPIPAPLPDPPAQQQPPQPPEDKSTPAPAPPQPLSRTFTGRITMDGGEYVLKTSAGDVYRIDDQQRAKPYEGREVKVVCTLAGDGQITRLINIEVIS